MTLTGEPHQLTCPPGFRRPRAELRFSFVHGRRAPAGWPPSRPSSALTPTPAVGATRTHCVSAISTDTTPAPRFLVTFSQIDIRVRHKLDSAHGAPAPVCKSWGSEATSGVNLECRPLRFVLSSEKRPFWFCPVNLDLGQCPLTPIHNGVQLMPGAGVPRAGSPSTCPVGLSAGRQNPPECLNSRPPVTGGCLCLARLPAALLSFLCGSRGAEKQGRG